jgi:hypothetical protein
MLISLGALGAGLFNVGDDRAGELLLGVVGVLICSGVAYLERRGRAKPE